MIESLADFLSQRLMKDLPGETAHGEMAPIQRPMPQEARQWESTRYSAVLILLYPHNNRIQTALMRRPDYGGVHSGQISFPGGGKEESDVDMRETALREAFEEMNILKEEVKVLGQLSELYIPPSKSLVTPVVGFASNRPEFIPDIKEVAEIIEADFFDILSDKYFGNTEIVTSSYLLKEVPVIKYNNHVIWGATAMIINEIKHILREYSTR